MCAWPLYSPRPEPNKPRRGAGQEARRSRGASERQTTDTGAGQIMGGAPCNVEPARRVRWRGLGRRRRKVQVVRLGGGGERRARGLLRRWLRRAARTLADIYMAALVGPPAPQGMSSYPAWTGLEPCFAAPFMVGTRPCWW
jgi:hypothetical protein